MIWLAARMLVIYVDEGDREGDVPLYEAVVRRLRQHNVRGASAHVGLMGFGRHQRLHQKGIWGVPDDRPVLITAIDSESVLLAALAEIQPIVKDRTVALLHLDLMPPSS